MAIYSFYIFDRHSKSPRKPFLVTLVSYEAMAPDLFALL